MQRMELTAKTREPKKGISNKLRKDGNVPAVLYGVGVEPKNISVNHKEIDLLEKKNNGFNFLIDLKVEKEKPTLTMIRDYQSDVITRNFIHLDFQVIDITKKLDVEVPFNLVGTPIGVKEGGVMNQLRRKIHLKAIPTSIPEYIDIDVSNLKIGDSIHADEVKLPEGVEFPHAVNYTVVTVVVPTKIEAAPAPAAIVAEGEAGAAPAEGEKKAEGEAAPAGAEKQAATPQKGAEASKKGEK